MRRKNPKFDSSNSDRREDESRGSSDRRGPKGSDNRGKHNKGRDKKHSGRSFDERKKKVPKKDWGERKKPSFGRYRDKETEQEKTREKADKPNYRDKDGDKKKSFKKERGDRKFAPKRDNFSKRYKDDKKSLNKGKRTRTKRNQEPATKDDGLIRLNKYIANSGMCSRRQADEYIKTGVVEVNGTVVTEMGYKVKPEDDVRFDGQRLTPERKTYLLLNKPKGFITTTNDEKDRKTVMDLVGNATKTRIFPVGRLDRQTTGVLLFTNDGYLAKKLTHPSHQVKKIYHVILDKNLHGDDMEKIRQGIRMHEGVAKVDKISFIDGKDRNEVGVEIHIGWNRVVRRLFEKLGYKVVALDRVQFAGLTKKLLKRGDWRLLDQKEVNFLKMM